jgi:hypothetical protein
MLGWYAPSTTDQRVTTVVLAWQRIMVVSRAAKPTPAHRAIIWR